MAKRRGFFAELNHQAQLAERRRQQQIQAAYRAQAAAQRAAEQAHRSMERARAASARASAAEQQAAEKEAARLYVESRQAEAASMNANLVEIYAEIDGLLEATLEVDDWVNLESLRVGEVRHPAFDAAGLDAPLAPPPPPQYPPEPIWREPEPLKGIAGALGGRKKHEAWIAHERAAYDQAYRAHRAECESLYGTYQRYLQQHAAAEQQRVASLTAAELRYHQECRQREQDATRQNADIEKLINELAFDVPWAIHEYIDIVLSNSVYPDSFPIEHDHRFDLETRELQVTVRIPEPSAIPPVKEYRYVKAKDEIAATSLALRDQKERYASAAWQVALRTLHEVFEADRAQRIHTISLTVDTESLDVATGRPGSVPFVTVGVAREMFNGFDLQRVVPAATLKHLGAAMSKSPFDLVPADTARGVRAQGR